MPPVVPRFQAAVLLPNGEELSRMSQFTLTVPVKVLWVPPGVKTPPPVEFTFKIPPPVRLRVGYKVLP